MGNEIARNFKDTFLIDSSKLSRLLSVIDERYKALKSDFVAEFEISTKSGKNLKTNNIEDITTHDNSLTNPITNLNIFFKDKAEEPENLCEIIYDKDYSLIKVKVNFKDVRKGKDLFAEIEEQIERSLEKSWVYSMRKQKPIEHFMLIIMIPFMLFALYATATQKKQIQRTI